MSPEPADFSSLSSLLVAVVEVEDDLGDVIVVVVPLEFETWINTISIF